MLILFLALLLFTIIQTMYLLYYKSQIRDVGNQLAFILKHDSFKLIQTQIKPHEISSLIKRCNDMLTKQRELNQQFSQKNEEMNATIVSLSHDIRTPLTSLDGYLQLAERTENTEEKAHYIKLAQSRTGRINSLVDELFLYTRLKNKDYPIELTRVDVGNLLKQRLFSFLNDFTKKGYEPNIDLPDSAIHIIGNNHAIERVIENIIKNYLRHGTGSLTIQAEEIEKNCAITFTNKMKAGTAIDPERIFTRFYKADASRSTESSGLGLFIVNSLMEKMHGFATVDIEQDQFQLRLIFSKTWKEEDE